MNIRKIGILGGTFDPIHIGHLLLAQWALDGEGLDEVWLIPTGYSYMKDKQNIVPAWDRYEMVSRAVEDNPRLSCLDLEILREGATYTCDTLEELRRLYPDYQFYFIFGADCLFTMEEWKDPEKIFANCILLAAMRDENSLAEMERRKRYLEERYEANIRLLPFLQLEISSTAVRERIREGGSVRYLVPDRVLSYIQEKGFYGYEEK